MGGIGDTMRHVLTSPGFGEKPDAKGLYPEIESVYGDSYQFHMLDFYERHDKNRVVPPLANQVSILHNEIDKIPLSDEITIIAKSGGTRPVVSIDDAHVRRINRFVLFVPPWHRGNASLKNNLTKWGGAERQDGSWTVPRRNGGEFIVSREYVQEVGELSLMDSYQRIAKLSKLMVIRAMEDEITPPLQVDKIDGARHIDIEGADHHFTVGDCRARAIEAMVKHAVLDI
jgi:hypothetical protein